MGLGPQVAAPINPRSISSPFLFVSHSSKLGESSISTIEVPLPLPLPCHEPQVPLRSHPGGSATEHQRGRGIRTSPIELAPSIEEVVDTETPPAGEEEWSHPPTHETPPEEVRPDHQEAIDPSTAPTNSNWAKEPAVHHQHPYARDELDSLIERAAQHYQASSTWKEFATACRGGTSDFHRDVGNLPHPAAPLLESMRTQGAAVPLSTAPWSQGRIKAAILRGPHKSTKEHISSVRTEFTGMMNKGQWGLLPAKLLADEAYLRVSPLGVVPQWDRRPRTIADYTYFEVNDDTLEWAPQESMQFGRAFQRLIQRIHRAHPKHGPIYISKVDVADGFYRIWVLAEDAPKLAVLFPTRAGEPALVGIPMALPMGWKESPPHFSVATETIVDLANSAIVNPHVQPGVHRLDVISETPPTGEAAAGEPALGGPSPLPTSSVRARPRTHRPLEYWDVYVDDFIGLAQGNAWKRRHAKRILLHTLDKVLRPVEPGDNPHRQEPASVKKMLKGDACWTTRKVILGWVVDTVTSTVELPPHRADRLQAILDSIQPGQRRVATKTWHQVLGELRSMAVASPGMRGLFSTLQEAFRHVDTDGHRLRLRKPVHDFLKDFRWLARDLASRPTRMGELVPNSIPDTVGACDAAGTGMGGVHFVPDATGVTPLLWRTRFPQGVQNQLVSYTNPTGRITNSDLELAGSVLHLDVLAQAVDTREKTVHNCYDNTPTVAWQRKGSATTTGPAAYLLRLQAIHQRHFRYVPLHDYMPGKANVMADTCSRAWHLTDAALLNHFDLTYPQNRPWRLCNPRKQMRSAVISALYRTRSAPASLLNVPTHKTTIGNDGLPSAWITALTHSYAATPTLSPSSRSTVSAIATGDALPTRNPSELAWYQMPYVPLARRSPVWGPMMLAKTSMGRSTTASLSKFDPTAELTRHRHGSSRCPSPL